MSNLTLKLGSLILVLENPTFKIDFQRLKFEFQRSLHVGILKYYVYCKWHEYVSVEINNIIR